MKQVCTWLKKHNALIFATVITAIYFIVLCGMNCMKLQKDDAMMRSIVDGSYTGTPDGHMVFCKYIYGFLLSRLYLWNSRINWYGIIFVLMCAACMFLALTKIFRLNKNKARAYIWVVVYLAFFTITFWKLLMDLNFTWVATILGATGVFYLCTLQLGAVKNEYICDIIVVIITLTICYWIREEVFYVAFCFGGLAVLYKVLEQYEDCKIKLRRLMPYMLMFLLIIAGTGIIEKIAYDTESWSEYNEYNKNRATLVDYYGIPGYNDAEEIYLKYGVDSNKASLLQSYCLMLDGVDNRSLINELAEKKRDNIQSYSILTMISGAIARFDINFYNQVNYIYIICFMGILFFASNVKKDKKMVVFLLLGLSLYFVMWFYLMYKGRDINRGYVPVEVISLMYLLGIHMTNATEIGIFEKAEGKWLIYTCILLASMGFTVMSLRLGIEKSEDNEKDCSKIAAVLEYCVSNSEKFYYTMSGDFAYSQDNQVYNTAQAENIFYVGGWMTNSPLSVQKQSNYNLNVFQSALIENEIVYYIDSSKNSHVEELITYYVDNDVRVKYDMIDEIKSEHSDEIYRIYKFGME